MKENEFGANRNGSEKNRATAPHFKGVFARDSLPKNPEEGFYIMNFDKLGEPGSHWVCMQIGKSRNSYFDSYGKRPPKFVAVHFHRFLGNKKKIERNSKQLQSEFSTTCGQWCMYFVWRKCTGWNMKNITSPFKTEIPLTNDYVMNNLVRKTFGTDKNVIDRPFLKEQMCKQMNKNIAEWAKLL